MTEERPPASPRARLLLGLVVLLGAVAVGLVTYVHSRQIDAPRPSAAPGDPTAPGTVLIELRGDPTARVASTRPAPRRDDASTRSEPGASEEPTAARGDVTPATPAESTRTHVVRPHDTLRGLARRYYGDPERWTEIQRANGLTSTIIRRGQELRIP